MTQEIKISKCIGSEAEELAYHYLTQQGLQLLARNYYCRLGEIDLIMQQQSTIVFIEVRYRKTIDYGTAIESILLHKKSKIIHTASYYLQQKKLSDKVNCRFDVIALQGNKENIEIQWIQDAFQSQS